MRLPTWDELVPKQRDILEYPLDEPLFVVGPPGSGKTVLAVRRAEAAAEENESVALVTYNRMLRRLASLLTDGNAVANTMHRFAYWDYRNRTGEAPPTFPGVETYSYDWTRMLAVLDDHPNSATTWEHVVVDEGQDLPAGFFEYLNRFSARVLTVFADEDQALGTRRTTLAEIQASADLPDPILLEENHRNIPEIALIAEHFHSGGLPTATVRRAAIGQRPRLLAKNFRDTVELIATWYENRGGAVGVIVSNNPLGESLLASLRSRLPNTRIDLYTSRMKNEEAIDLLDEGITIVNKESVKGQEFDSVFILELERFLPCVNDVMKRAMYMMCARARDYLFLVSGVAGLSPEAEACLPGARVLERG